MLAAARLGVASDSRDQRRARAQGEDEGGAQHTGAGQLTGGEAGARLLFERTRAVAQSQLRRRDRADLLADQQLDRHERVAHGASVRSGVADDRTADGAWDVAGELEPGQPSFGQAGDDRRQHGAGTAGEHLLADIGLGVAGKHDQAGQATVCYQHVGGLAENGDRHAGLMPGDDRMAQLGGRRRLKQELGGSADRVCAVGRQRHGLAEAAQLAPQLANAVFGSF